MSLEDGSHEDKLTRLREAAMTVREPRNAGELADTVGVAPNTARKYLEQLVDAGLLETVTVGRETRYAPNRKRQYLDQLRELTEGFTKEELTAELAAIRDDVDAWKREYDVDSPDELRISLGEEELDASDRERRSLDAEDWEYFDRRATMLQQAIALYDSLEAADSSRSRSTA